MNNVKNWLSIVTNNDLHAYNKVNTRDLAICMNFIQIPDTETVAITITVMKNKVKKNSLPPLSFAKIMSAIEEALETAGEEWYDHNTVISNNEKEYFVNVKSELDNQWYIQLCCHRVFFIPEDGLWETIKNLFNQDVIGKMKENDVDEVSVFINTEDYDFNGKFY